MAGRNQGHSDQRCSKLPLSMRQNQSHAHQSKPCKCDGQRCSAAMNQRAPPDRERRYGDREYEANPVNFRSEEEMPSDRETRNEQDAEQAMQCAQARKTNTELVETATGRRSNHGWERMGHGRGRP